VNVLIPLTTLLILGFRTRYVVIAAALVLVVLVVIAVIARRGRASKLELRELDPAAAQRYVEEFAAIEKEFLDHPDTAAARARGIAEEVMRRRGFPDRIETRQRVSDLGSHDKEAARALQAANAQLAGTGDDTERLRQAVQHYRLVVYRLTGTPLDRAA
jgi:hypothetical protein